MRQSSLAQNGWVILATTYYSSRHSSCFHVMCATGTHAQLARVISSTYNPLQHRTEQWFRIWHDSGRSRPPGMHHKIQERFAQHVFLMSFLTCLPCGPFSNTGYNNCFLFPLSIPKYQSLQWNFKTTEYPMLEDNSYCTWSTIHNY